MCTAKVNKYARKGSVQGHPTNLFLTLSVPHRNLAGWQNIRCSIKMAGKFLIVRGFGWELLTFLAFQAELAEKLWRPRTTEKKYPFPPPESSDKHLTAGQRDRVCGKNRFCVGYFCEGFQSARMSAHVQIEELSSFTCKINSHCYFICMLKFSWCSSTLNWDESSESNSSNLYFHSQI